MIEIRKFQAEDAEVLFRNSVDDIIKKVPEIILRKEVERKEKSCAFTGVLNGEVIGTGGVFVKRGGVGDFWLLLSKKALNHKLSVFKCIKRMIDIIAEKFELKKLRMESRKGFIQSQRLLEHLGFTRQRRELIRGDMFGNVRYLYIKGI